MRVLITTMIILISGLALADDPTPTPEPTPIPIVMPLVKTFSICNTHAGPNITAEKLLIAKLKAGCK